MEQELVSEIIAFSEYADDESRVVIITATGLSEEEFANSEIKVTTNGMEVNVTIGDQKHYGKATSNNMFNWKFAQIGSMDNFLQMTFSDFVEINAK